MVLAALTQGCQARTDAIAESEKIDNIEEWMGDPRNYVIPDTMWEIAESDLPSFRNRAAAGDVIAARELSYHYRELGNRAEGKRYARMAAAGGDCVTLLNLEVDRDLPLAERAEWADAVKRRRCDPDKEFNLTTHD